ncbi:hypothetical protein [Oceanobacillus neutriphilus]|uniref:YolD-like protein n=1 Tax=Oceanobacillus neutriphilus TaxID=531815 RepID=A0ABQ2NNF2_9BACI|nr:hypothetical protein [Oceanobacillus neutriphilus]GGP07253.1 hypothetical protein GCM10011346_02500 [Oceanobacillus neutriphilus]
MPDYAITRFTPEMYGYRDRGILKWQGMILADQTDALKELENEIAEIEGKEEMSEVEISQVLHRAYLSDYPVAIQANIIRNGSFYRDVICKVAGYGNNKIHLRLKDGRTTSCTLEEIRNVEFMDPLEWYDKRN